MKSLITRITILVLSIALMGPAAEAAFVTKAATATTATTEASATTTVAAAEKRHYTRAEKRQLKKDFKKWLKKQDSGVSTVLLVILAILLPPLAVYLHQNAINSKFWISLILSLLFWVPGVIYSLLVVLNAI